MSHPYEGGTALVRRPSLARVAVRHGETHLVQHHRGTSADHGGRRHRHPVPAFVGLIRERRLPVTLFLTDTVAGPAYGDLARLRPFGASLQNHTLDHRSLRGLPHAGQRAEICGQQTKLRSRFGVRAHLFRPPHGTYDTTTLRAAADCGITALVLWRATLDADGALTYTRGDHRLHPGDIVAVDPDHPTAANLAARTERLLETIEEQGLRVGNLENYL